MFRTISSFISIFVCTCILMVSCSKSSPKTVNETKSEQVILQDSVVQNLDEEKIPSFEAYCQSIHPNTEIEFFELSWPTDDRLCDSYDGSEGEMVYRIYRNKESKKIIRVDEDGYYCQGDSEYGYSYLFDEEGNAIYSYSGAIYNPTTVKFYESGKAIIEITYPGEGENDRPKEIKKINSTEVVTAKDFELKIVEYQQKMRNRLKGLKAMTFKNTETENKTEAENTIRLLEESLGKNIVYTDGYVLRKAMPIEKDQLAEATLVRGIDIRVRAEPNSSSTIIGKVSYYNNYMSVQDIQGMENISPYGSHPWYKINFKNATTNEYETGWIFGAFILEGVYPKR